MEIQIEKTMHSFINLYTMSCRVVFGLHWLLSSWQWVISMYVACMIEML